jgi:16S rRNA G966 N2-methylase RsmD
MTRIVEQIEGRRKAKDKLPVYYNNSGIVYPPSINLEQSSSETTAKFKGTIASQLSQTSSCADLTGGFGIDSFFLSKVFDTVEYIETNSELLEIAKHNHLQLGAKNIHHHNMAASAYLGSAETLIDCFYIDPSRRDASTRKVSSLDMCEPKILELLPSLFRRSQYVLLKTSPLLDITEAVKQLQKASHVYVVSVNNECKELLFLLNRDFTEEPLVDAINLSKENINSFPFLLSGERDLQVSFSDPEEFLYEPNASILKAGAFKSISKKFNIKKLHPNTHLYTSHQLLRDFPGRIFQHRRSDQI